LTKYFEWLKEGPTKTFRNAFTYYENFKKHLINIENPKIKNIANIFDSFHFKFLLEDVKKHKKEVMSDSPFVSSLTITRTLGKHLSFLLEFRSDLTEEQEKLIFDAFEMLKESNENYAEELKDMELAAKGLSKEELEQKRQRGLISGYTYYLAKNKL
jgi:hypothetical protein